MLSSTRLGRNPASVLPPPVGATNRVERPARARARSSSWWSRGVQPRAANQRAKRSGRSDGDSSGSGRFTRPSVERSAAQSRGPAPADLPPVRLGRFRRTKQHGRGQAPATHPSPQTESVGLVSPVLGAPLRTRTAHVVQFRPIRIAHPGDEAPQAAPPGRNAGFRGTLVETKMKGGDRYGHDGGTSTWDRLRTCRHRVSLKIPICRLRMNPDSDPCGLPLGTNDPTTR
jgi:hypothetical protein